MQTARRRDQIIIFIHRFLMNLEPHYVMKIIKNIWSLSRVYASTHPVFLQCPEVHLGAMQASQTLS